MTTASTLRQAIGRLLGEDLDSFVHSRRESGVSWRRIGVELYDVTAIDVSHETLRSWYSADDDTADSAA